MGLKNNQRNEAALYLKVSGYLVYNGQTINSVLNTLQSCNLFLAQQGKPLAMYLYKLYANIQIYSTSVVSPVRDIKNEITALEQVRDFTADWNSLKL